MESRKIDTHVHLLLSKKQTVPKWDEINLTISAAKSSGLDGLCITEHIEASGYRMLMEKIFIDNIFEGVRFGDAIRLENELVLYPGAEILLENGTNIGVHAPINVLLSINKAERYYSLEALHNFLEAKVCDYALVAHHIFWPGKTYPDHKELTDVVDAIEVPAKDFNNSQLYYDLADSYSMPVTGGSDAHNYIQVGASCTRFNPNISNFDQLALINGIRQGQIGALAKDHINLILDKSKQYRNLQLVQ